MSVGLCSNRDSRSPEAQGLAAPFARLKGRLRAHVGIVLRILRAKWCTAMRSEIVFMVSEADCRPPTIVENACFSSASPFVREPVLVSAMMASGFFEAPASIRLFKTARGR